MSESSFQGEIPETRVNIKLDLFANGAKKATELPLKILIVGDYSNGGVKGTLSVREKLNVNKLNFDSVLAEMSPEVNLTVKNILAGDGSEENIHLQFHNIKDFEAELVAKNIPQLKAMLAIHNLLRDLKSNLLDNVAFRKELKKVLLDPALSDELCNNLNARAPSQD
ncbi:type VI secretion system contractile sheath small subunit [Klebsiella aerogenes]